MIYTEVVLLKENPHLLQALFVGCNHLTTTFYDKNNMKLLDFFKSWTKPNSKKNVANSMIHTKKEWDMSSQKITYNSTTTLSDVLNFIRDNSNQLGIYLINGASDNEIEHFEKYKMVLPDDFVKLYKFSNGFETDEDIFRLIPLDEILNNEKDDYLISNNSFHFTEYMIYCDMWTVDINPKNRNDYRIYNKVDDIVFLTTSIAEFLIIFINKGLYEGLYQWREDIKAIEAP
jgi:sRNA-binding regulator protein Hfq